MQLKTDSRHYQIKRLILSASHVRIPNYISVTIFSTNSINATPVKIQHSMLRMRFMRMLGIVGLRPCLYIYRYIYYIIHEYKCTYIPSTYGLCNTTRVRTKHICEIVGRCMKQGNFSRYCYSVDTHCTCTGGTHQLHYFIDLPSYIILHVLQFQYDTFFLGDKLFFFSFYYYLSHSLSSYQMGH